MKETIDDKKTKQQAINYVLENPYILIEYKELKRAYYKENHNETNSVSADLLYHNFLEKYGYLALLGCNLLRSRHYQRVKRISDRIENIVIDAFELGYELYFITFTFTDKYLEKTIFEYRRKLIERLLKKYGWHFVANVDFGQDEKYSQREHYHAFGSIVNLAKLKKEFNRITKSFVHAKSYRFKKRDSKYIANYIIKLVNHSIKDSTQNTRVLFDRNSIWSSKVLSKKDHQKWVYEQLHKEVQVNTTPYGVICDIIREYEKENGLLNDDDLE